MIPAALLALLAAASAPYSAASAHIELAQTEECEEAIQDYRSAVDDIASALRSYARCVNGSEGQDDCSSKFRALRSAQDDFENAVGDIGSSCE